MRPFYYPELAYVVDLLQNAIIVYKILGYKILTEYVTMIHHHVDFNVCQGKLCSLIETTAIH